jgi:non-specific serine/threonine protein kinase
MSPLLALATADRAPESGHLDTFAELILACLDTLADRAQASGQRRRAARYAEAAALLRDETALDAEPILSARQWEVAVLVSRGQSNRQIAIELVVSERTVDTHVSHILRRLEVNTRAQIAAWVVQRQRRLTVLA